MGLWLLSARMRSSTVTAFRLNDSNIANKAGRYADKRNREKESDVEINGINRGMYHFAPVADLGGGLLYISIAKQALEERDPAIRTNQSTPYSCG